jgi:hypothetical protein
MEFIESERGNQKLNIKLKKNCGGQLSRGLLTGGQLSGGGVLSCSLWFIWLSSFKGEDFVEINQSETRIACGGHVCKPIEMK